MRTTNYGAKLEWNLETGQIYRIDTGELVEDFNLPIWVGADCEERRIRWHQLTRLYSKNQKSSLDF